MGDIGILAKGWLFTGTYKLPIHSCYRTDHALARAVAFEATIISYLLEALVPYDCDLPELTCDIKYGDIYLGDIVAKDPDGTWRDFARFYAGKIAEKAIEAAKLKGAEVDAAAERKINAMKDLGTVTGFGDSLYRSAGAVLDALVPDVGSTGRAQVNFNVPVYQTVGASAKVGFELNASADRSAKAVTARCDLGLRGTIEGEVYGLAKAFASAKVYGYVEASGDSGEEVFRLVSLAVYKRVAAIDEEVADQVWGGRFADRTVAGMDDDDYVELGGGVQASAGYKVDVGNDLETSGKVSAAVEGGWRLDKVDGQLTERGIIVFKVGAEMTLGPWAGSFEVVVKRYGGKVQEIAISLTNKASIDLKDLSSKQFFASVAGGAVKYIAQQVSGDAQLGEGSTGRSVSQAMGYLDAAAAGGFGKAVVSQAAVDKLKSGAAKIGCALDLKLNWTPAKTQGEIKLSRLSSLEFGIPDKPGAELDENSLVYVALESGDPVIRVGINE